MNWSSVMVSTMIAILLLVNKMQATNLVCYYNSLTAALESSMGIDKYYVSNIDPTLCTHYVYAYAMLNGTSFQINSFNSTNDIDSNTNGYKSFTALKSKNAKAQFWLALGGQDDSNTTKYSTLVKNPANIRTLVDSTVAFLKQYNFDGLSLDWLFPNSTDDFNGYASLIVALKLAFQPENLSLATTVSAVPSTIDGYNVSVLNKYVDMVHLNTYDYHTPKTEPNTARHPHPLYCPTNDSAMANVNANHSVNYWLANGLSPELVNLGMALYGWSWSTGSGTPPSPPVKSSGYGSNSYDDIKGLITSASFLIGGSNTKYQDTNKTGPYSLSMYGFWSASDDPTMAAIKANYVLKYNLGGAMLFDISRDDFTNFGKYGYNPMTVAVAAVLNSSFYQTTTTTTMTTLNPTTVVSTYLPSNTTPTSTNKTPTTSASTGGCPSTRDAILPNPSSCRQFYICLDGVAYSTSCSSAKYFNPATMRCEDDDPTNPKCPSSNSGGSKKSEALSYNAVKYDWQVKY